MDAKYLTKQCTCPTGPFGPCDSCKATTDAAKLREAAKDCLTKAEYFPSFAGSSELLARHVLTTIEQFADALRWHITCGHKPGCICVKCDDSRRLLAAYDGEPVDS